MGLLRAEDPETGQSDVTIHRMCVHGPDRLSVYFVPGRHIDQFRIKAEAAGRPLPVSINIGLDPAIYVASCFEPPTTPLGFDELGIAGALRGRPVELAPCVSVAAKAIAHAEIVIEGEILPNERVREDALTGLGFAMPEFPGYLGKAQAAVPVIRVRAVTHRREPIFQTLVGPGAEHVQPDRDSHRGQHLPPGGRDHAQAVAQRLRASGRRGEICRHSSVPQELGRRRRQAAPGRAGGVRRVSGAEARHPGG